MNKYELSVFTTVFVRLGSHFSLFIYYFINIFREISPNSTM